MTRTTKNPDLMEVLLNGSPDDLSVLADYITDSGQGRLSLRKGTTQTLNRAKKLQKFDKSDRMLIARELTEFGGNSLANFLRSGGVSYQELVRDVADHLGAECDDKQSTIELEQAILAALAEKAFKQANAKDRAAWRKEFGIPSGTGPASAAAILAILRAGGFSSYRIALVVANATARALLGRGMSLAANAALTRGVSVLMGPIGLIITSVWTLYDLASPAYRVTVPCVIQVAYMRLREHHGNSPRG